MRRNNIEANKAIATAWEREQQLVREGKGTRDWTTKQQEDILEKGRAYDDEGRAFQGQHMKSAEAYPEYQGNPDNIQFLTREEHFEAHGGNWRNPTNGYYDPLTKVMTNFGERELIPCPVIKLSNPIMISSYEGDGLLDETIPKESDLPPRKEIGTSKENINDKVTVPVQKNVVNRIEQKKARVPFLEAAKSFAKKRIKYAIKHPVQTLFKIAGTVYVASEVYNSISSNSKGSNSGVSYSSKDSTNDDNGVFLDNSENDIDNILQEDNNTNNGNGSAKSPHLRHGHKSHRWTKNEDGELELKEIWIDDTAVNGYHDEDN